MLAGLDDLSRGRESEAALVVQVAAPRLRALGFEILQCRVGLPEDGCESCEDGSESPEHRLYSLLVRERGGGAHSRYNALLARMTSFVRAAAHASTG